MAPEAFPKLSLLYWEAPGRAEAIRLLFRIGGIPFDDVHVTQEEFVSKYKAQTPFGQIPVLTVDGTKQLAQSGAIERYAAKLAKLYPEDAWEAAKVEEIVHFLSEIADVIRATHLIPDPAERIKARAERARGPVSVKLAKLTELLQSSGSEWFVGGRVTYADVVVFSTLSWLISGWLEGVPNNLLDDFPSLKAHHNSVAALPAVAAFYAKAEGVRAAYRHLQ